MESIFFIQSSVNYIVSGSFIVYISVIINKQELLLKLSKALNFPNYFGNNWDALCEMYRDFGWIDDKEIVIVHENLTELNEPDLKIYMEIILIAIDFWKMDDAHNLVFVFSEKDKTRIIHVLNSITNL